MELEVTKMQGLGNNYVVIEDLSKKLEKNYPKIANIISDRNFGIGSDGILVVNKGKLAKYHMRIFNPDGSEAELSGNGARIFSKYLFDKKMIGRKANIEAGGKNGGRLIKVSVENGGFVTVEMGKGVIVSQKTISANGAKFTGYHVEVGNPHFVMFVKNEKTAKKYADVYGSSIEHNKAFPKGVNVEFAYIKNKKEIVIHVWERGTGITIACGTGACASAFIASKNGMVSNPITVKLIGGYLNINVKPNNTILMRGPAGHILSGTFHLDEAIKNRG